MTFAGKDENNKVSVSWINGMVLYHPQKLVEWSERMYEDQLFSTAQKIAQRSKECSILLLSGPSASSKRQQRERFLIIWKHKGYIPQ